MDFQNFLKLDDVNSADLPNVLKYYYELKIQYKDFIVFYRAGEFFETYFDDAYAFSDCAGVTLTCKKFKKLGEVLMAGVPHKSIDIHIDKLLKAGFKVVIVDQTENKDENNCLIRKVAKIYTQGTLLETELLNSAENNYLGAVFKKNNKYEICYGDISVGDIFISFGNLQQVKCELARICPKELLVQDENSEFKELYKTEVLPPEAFNEGAYGAVLYYAKYILKEYTPKLEVPHNYSIEKNLLMDFYTRKNLELTQNSYNHKKYGSLLWALDNCKTPMGRRLLSYYISTPLYDLAEIQKRQKAVEEFLSVPQYADKLGRLLENIGDIARLTSKLSNGTINPYEFITLKQGLENISEIQEISSHFKSEMLLNKDKNSKVLADFCDIIKRTITDDVQSIKSGGNIKSGANADLDLLNMQYENAVQKIYKYEQALKKTTKINSLKIIFKSGYYSIEVLNTSKNPLGSEFRPVQILKNSTRYTTDELLYIEKDIFCLKAKIEALKQEILHNLRQYSKEMTAPVRQYSKYLAVLDVIFSIYKSVKIYNLKCPEFSETLFEITKGRHIAAQKILGAYEPLDFGFKNSNFIMLTGANGAGKSTLLKQTAAMIILAQCGFYVPCDSAKIPLIDRLFTVLNISDEFVNKKSSHQAQMSEVARIIKNLTPKSLVLLDEIGKSTSYKEGMSLSYGLIRYLLEETSAKTLFATHYTDLKQYLKSGVSYLEITINNSKRQVINGVVESSGGIASAGREDLPEKIINYANSIVQLV